MDMPSLIGYIVGVGGALTIVFSKAKTDNLKDLKDRVELLEKEREEARQAHIENQKAIAHLEGQLSTYKEIPLKSIAETLEKLSTSTDSIKTSNSQILSTLKGDAATAKAAQADGGLLVKTKKANPLAVEVKE